MSKEYLEDLIVLEAKDLNMMVKEKYLEDITKDLQAQNTQNRVSANSAMQRQREMKKQTLLSITHTIQLLRDIGEYKVAEINGVKINGPLKFLVLIFGPNHQAKDLKSLT